MWQRLYEKVVCLGRETFLLIVRDYYLVEKEGCEAVSLSHRPLSQWRLS